MKYSIALLLMITVLGQVAIAIAAPPDPETDALIRERYNVLLFTSRSCAYFANPKTAESAGNNRSIWVLNASNDDTGTLCRGVFRFLWLNVNCQTKTLTFTDSAPSFEDQQRNKVEYVNEEVAQKICEMPASQKP